MINMKIVDLQINVDGLILKKNESIEDYINKIKNMTNSNYEIQYEILYEEEYD